MNRRKGIPKRFVLVKTEELVVGKTIVQYFVHSILSIKTCLLKFAVCASLLRRVLPDQGLS